MLGWYNKKHIRNFSDLKNVTNAASQETYPNFSDLKNVTNVASQKTYPNFFGLEKCHECGITKNLFEFFRTWKMSYHQAAVPRARGYNKKPIRNFSDLKNVTNAASQKTCPNFFGLEKCHECGITKNLSEFFRTWKMSRMSANLTQLVGLEFCHGWVRLIFVPQKNLSIG